MIDAVIGSIIIMTASLALVLAIEVAEKTINNAGAQPLSYSEKAWLEEDLGFDPSGAELKVLEQELKELEGG